MEKLINREDRNLTKNRTEEMKGRGGGEVKFQKGTHTHTKHTVRPY